MRLNVGADGGFKFGGGAMHAAALDVTIQGQILYEAQKLCRETGAALIWITHDLSVVAGLADDVCVMYAGRVVESGAVDAVLDAPLPERTVRCFHPFLN